MDEGANGEAVPDLRDIEVKIGRKTPEGLLKWMREEASSLRGDSKVMTAHDVKERDTEKKSLDDKIRKLKLDMAHLRSVDVKILQQLLAIHEGIEAVKWLAEERSTLTSHCSSLTGSQYSLGDGADTSWRGSWSSLHDPNDKLDNISIGSYLDTLADDMDEYGPSGSDPSVLCSSAPPASEAAPAEVAGGGVGGRSAPATTVACNWPNGRPVGAGVRGGASAGGLASVAAAAVGGNRSSAPDQSKEVPKEEAVIWTKAKETAKKDPAGQGNSQARSVKKNSSSEKSANQTGGSEVIQPCLSEKLGKSQSPKFNTYRNGKVDLETCKMNGKLHLEYDAHWRWVQSQEDVTFL